MASDIDLRVIMVGVAGANPLRKKETGDIFDYLLDTSNWLIAGETVQSASATVSPAGLTLGTPSVAGDVVELRVSSGTTNTTYVVTVDITLADGQHKTTKFTVWVL